MPSRLLFRFMAVIVAMSFTMNLMLLSLLHDDTESHPSSMKQRLHHFKNPLNLHAPSLTHPDFTASVATVAKKHDHGYEHDRNHVQPHQFLLTGHAKAEEEVEANDRIKKKEVDDDHGDLFQRNDAKIKPPDQQPNHQLLANVDRTDKERIIQILQEAGTELTPQIIESLPTWTEVTSLYGTKPKIHGLETCQSFQTIVAPDRSYIGPSGIFNTGTNLLASLLKQYCVLPERQKRMQQEQPNARERMVSGMLLQVPWGKHNPISWRRHHVALLGATGVEQINVLPVVTIKDPYHWMGSMCRHKYAANWVHTEMHCPNLVPNKFDYGRRGVRKGVTKSIEIVVPFKSDRVHHYTSMVDLWNTWYTDYLDAGSETGEKHMDFGGGQVDGFPRLIIRFEDLLFHLEETFTQVCHCGGGKLINHEKGIHLLSDSAKPGHKGSSGLLSAILRYGKADKRLETMTSEDLEYAEDNLSGDMMQMFGYSYPPRNI